MGTKSTFFILLDSLKLDYNSSRNFQVPRLTRHPFHSLLQASTTCTGQIGVHTKKLVHKIFIANNSPCWSRIAFSNPGMAWIICSCISAGIVHDKPPGYIIELFRPSGSSQTICCFPANLEQMAIIKTYRKRILRTKK